MLADSTVLFAALADDGQLTWISESARWVLGRSAASLTGSNALDLLHPDDHAIVIETLAEPARGADDRIRVALRMAHLDGTWISLEFGGIDLREPDGSGAFLVWGSPNEATGWLLGFLQALMDGASLDSVLAQVVHWHDTSTPGTRSAALVRDEHGAYRCLAAAPALPPDLAFDLIPGIEPAGPWDEARRTEQPAQTTDVTVLAPPVADAATAAGIHAVWAVPVLAPGADEPLALVVHWRHRPGPMLATQRRQSGHTAQVVRLAIEWSRNQAALVTAATTDPLTGLANRAQLDAAIRADRSPLAAVLFCDLDDFKQINDRHGHLVGDRILRESARRMAGAVRQEDLLVRLGGDEFAIWCPRLDSPLDAESVARRIVAVLDLPIELDGHTHRIGCSVGLALVDQGEPWSRDVDRLLGAADQALYRAKAAGKNRWATAQGTDERLPFPD